VLGLCKALINSFVHFGIFGNWVANLVITLAVIIYYFDSFLSNYLKSDKDKLKDKIGKDGFNEVMYCSVKF
jgi:hypothetical protein